MFLLLSDEVTKQHNTNSTLFCMRINILLKSLQTEKLMWAGLYSVRFLADRHVGSAPKTWWYLVICMWTVVIRNRNPYLQACCGLQVPRVMMCPWSGHTGGCYNRKNCYTSHPYGHAVYTNQPFETAPAVSPRVLCNTWPIETTRPRVWHHGPDQAPGG